MFNIIQVTMIIKNIFDIQNTTFYQVFETKGLKNLRPIERNYCSKLILSNVFAYFLVNRNVFGQI